MRQKPRRGWGPSQGREGSNQEARDERSTGHPPRQGHLPYAGASTPDANTARTKKRRKLEIGKERVSSSFLGRLKSSEARDQIGVSRSKVTGNMGESDGRDGTAGPD